MFTIEEIKKKKKSYVEMHYIYNLNTTVFKKICFSYSDPNYRKTKFFFIF